METGGCLRYRMNSMRWMERRIVSPRRIRLKEQAVAMANRKKPCNEQDHSDLLDGASR